MEVDATVYRSPKRKRGHTAPRPTPLVTSGLSQVLSPPSSSSDQLIEHSGSHSPSPSTRVTGKFQKLDLQSPIDLSTAPVLACNQSTQVAGSESSPEPEPVKTSTAETEQTKPFQEFKPPESAEFRFESPSTPALTLKAGTLPRTKSPPPSSVVSDQFWHASEITGWSPDDPDEDYYGVNGVGYAKPAGKAWAISQKRKQQIAEYRSRETREARQRRHEKRLSGFGESGSRRGSPRGSPRPGPKVDETGETGEKKAVRFVHIEDG